MRRAPVCMAPGCWGAAVATPAAIPLCAAHFKAVTEAIGPASAPPPAFQVNSIVYFVTWDNGETVKIGITTSPRARWAQLRSGRASFEILVAHPGGRLEEQAAHHRFAHLYTGQKEVFHYAEGLPGYVADLKARWPHWARTIQDLQAMKDSAPRRPVGSLGRFPAAVEQDRLV